MSGINDTCPYRKDGFCSAPGAIPGPCDVDCTYIDFLRRWGAQLERQRDEVRAEFKQLCGARAACEADCQKLDELCATIQLRQQERRLRERRELRAAIARFEREQDEIRAEGERVGREAERREIRDHVAAAMSLAASNCDSYYAATLCDVLEALDRRTAAEQTPEPPR